MTQFAAQPIMLTMSPTSTTTNTNIPTPSVPDLLYRRRSSIRRGTISSLSKDVRVNDFVEIIKKQKEIQQQERDTVSLLLKRRHSMANINNNKKQQVLKSLQPRTMSNTDLVWQQPKMIVSPLNSIKDHLEKGGERGQQMDKVRLVEQQEDHHQHQHHLRNCEACSNNNNKQQQVSPLTSPSCSTSSSCSSSSCSSMLNNNKRPPFIKVQQEASTDILYNSSGNTLLNKEQEIIIHELKKNISNYSHDINSLLFNISSHQQSTLAHLYEEEEEGEQEELIKNKIHECKSLVQQQQELLNKLLESVQEPPPPMETPLPFNDIIPKQKNLLSTVAQEFYKGFTYPKPTTTGIVIKQTKDKKLENAVFIVDGICTTIESSLIPDRLLNNKDTTMTSFNQKGIYQHSYSLNITYQDKHSLFKLLSEKEWQKDNQVTTCSFKNCNCQFNWFIRKHHCRSCGQIYCHTHSSNRLPLFKKPQDKVPVFSRVCDKCFYHVANDSLSSLL